MKLALLIAMTCGLFRVFQSSDSGLDHTSFTVEAYNLPEAARKASPSPGLRITKIEEVNNVFEMYIDGKPYGGMSKIRAVGSNEEFRDVITYTKEPLVIAGDTNLAMQLIRITKLDSWRGDIVIRKVPHR